MTYFYKKKHLNLYISINFVNRIIKYLSSLHPESSFIAMSFKNLVKKYFFPREIKIISIFEIILYACVLSLVLFYYKEWNQIPTMYMEINASNDNALILDEKVFRGRAYADIDIILPMGDNSFDDSSDGNYNNPINLGLSDIGRMDLLLPREAFISGYNKEYDNYGRIYVTYRKADSKKVLVNHPLNDMGNKYLDSLTNSHHVIPPKYQKQRFSTSLKFTKLGHKQSSIQEPTNWSNIDDSLAPCVVNNNFVLNSIWKGNYLGNIGNGIHNSDTLSYYSYGKKINEQQLIIIHNGYSKGDNSDRHKTPLHFMMSYIDLYVRPEFFSKFDVSQCYTKIDLNTNLIDSVSLRIDFRSCVELSNMNPSPDYIDMRSVIFNDQDKIECIRNKGLWFHANFPEMRSMQNVRLFSITAIMSVFISALINLTLILVSLLVITARNRIHKTEKQ